MRFSILGPLEARDGTRTVEVGTMKQRIVLALLLCRANGVVSVPELSDALWDDEPPRTAHKNLQTYVSALRRTLGTSAELLYRPPGYQLRVDAEQVDVLAFHGHVRAGRLAARAGDAAGAARDLGKALRLWRGPVLAELQSVPAIATEAARLTDRCVAAYEDWAEAELALGHHALVAEGIAELALSHPLRERLRHSHMLALYRSGRQAEALAQFEALRQLLARDLGLRPSPVLRRLYEAMLSEDCSVDPPGRRDTRETLVTAAATPSRTARAERVRLPRDLTDFTGRAEHISVLLEALGGPDGGRVALVTGPAGIGKSALAAHCAHRLGQRFPGARVAVGLRTADGRARPGSEVVAELLRGVGVTGPLPRGLDARAALLREAAQGPATLFVLDDAASQVQISSLLALLPDGAVLVTGRRLFGGVESAVHIRLPPLSAGQGRNLLERIVGAERVRAEPHAARELVALCGGLPLAIRIVGVKLAGLGHLTLARYAARLAEPDRLLDELAAGGLRLRPRLAAWYHDLDPEDRATLRRLAFSGSEEFGVAEAAALLGVGPRQAEPAIERLVEMHFVDAGTDTDTATATATDTDTDTRADADADAPEVLAHALHRSPAFRLPPLVRIFLRDQASR